MIALIVMSVVFVAAMSGAAVWLWRRSALAGTRAAGAGALAARTAQEFLGFETVREDMIVVGRDSFRAVLEVQPVSFWLKSPGEQGAILLAYKRVMDAQEEPCQIYVPSLRVDPREPASMIRAATMAAPGQLQGLGEVMAVWVELYLGGRTLYRRSNYLILSYDFRPAPGRARPSEEEIRALARRNLAQRAEAITKGLKGTGLVVRRLGSEEIIDFLYAFYNRDRSRLGGLSESLRDGCLSPYVTGEGIKHDEAAGEDNDAGAEECAGHPGGRKTAHAPENAQGLHRP